MRNINLKSIASNTQSNCIPHNGFIYKLGKFCKIGSKSSSGSKSGTKINNNGISYNWFWTMSESGSRSRPASKSHVSFRLMPLSVSRPRSLSISHSNNSF